MQSFQSIPTSVQELYLPEFDSEDEAIELLTAAWGARNANSWYAAFLLAAIVTVHGDGTFVRACQQAGIDPDAGMRLRWLGATWNIGLVRMYDHLSMKHFERITAVVNDLRDAGDTAGLSHVARLMRAYNEGELHETTGKIKIKSAESLRHDVLVALGRIAPDPEPPATPDTLPLPTDTVPRFLRAAGMAGLTRDDKGNHFLFIKIGQDDVDAFATRFLEKGEKTAHVSFTLNLPEID